MNKQADVKTPEPVNNMSKFMVRERANNNPSKVFLTDPATGMDTEDWVMVRSSMSDAFQNTKDELMQDAVNMPLEKKERDEKKAYNQLRLRAALLHSWSFPKECTEEAKIEFLREAPQVSNMLLRVADDSARFFGTP